MSASGFTDPRKPVEPPFPGMRAMPQQGPVTLADAEASTKEVADWAGLTDLQKLRRASTETIFAMGTLYSSATGKRSVLTASPISPYIDGYVLTEGFDEACVDGTLADVPYMIGYTLNDAGNMEPAAARPGPTSSPARCPRTAVRTSSRARSTPPTCGSCSSP